MGTASVGCSNREESLLDVAVAAVAGGLTESAAADMFRPAEWMECSGSNSESPSRDSALDRLEFQQHLVNLLSALEIPGRKRKRTINQRGEETVDAFEAQNADSKGVRPGQKND